MRYDIEISKVANEVQPASPWLPQYLAEMEITSLDPGIKSKILSPRLGLIYDIFGNGKDVIKLNLARYGGQTGYEFASFINPAPWAEIDLRWVDLNGDGRVTANELFGTDPGHRANRPSIRPTPPAGPSTAVRSGQSDQGRIPQQVRSQLQDPASSMKSPSPTRRSS